MVFCKKCDGEVQIEQEEVTGYVVCIQCGSILDQSAWSADPTFNKDGGECSVAGHFVSNAAGTHGLGRITGGRSYGIQYDATEKACSKGKSEIDRLVDVLEIRPRDDVCNAAHRIYMLAVQHNFTRGRRTAQVAAAAIYIICRQDNHPFMLLDFSDVLQVNVFVLGAVFLQLCKLLRLGDHPIMNRPVDPSLFLHRFADRMGFGKKMQLVASTALRLVSSMKRDWLLTGRRPAGVCGAALYIAGHIHGFSISKHEVIRVVHVGDSTLEKRVSEFTTTDACDMTVEEFEEHSNELQAEERRQLEAAERLSLPAPADGSAVGTCSHIKSGVPLFAHNMCKDCFVHYLEITGGGNDRGAANPPAFKASLDENRKLALENGSQPLLLRDQEDEEEGDEDKEDTDELENDLNEALNDESLGALKAVVPVDAPLASKRRKRKELQKKRKIPPTQKPVAKKPRKGRGGGKTDNAKASQLNGVSQSESERADRNAPQIKGPKESGALQSRKEATQLQTPNHCQALVPHEGATEIGREGEIVVANSEDEDVEEPKIKETLSDLSEDEAEYLHTPEEAKFKDILWTAMNQDYIDKQQLKAMTKAKQPEEEPQAPEESGKRSRGRPKGSKTKPRPEETLQPSATAADGIRRVLDAKKLSSKINYASLNSLFDEDEPAAETNEEAEQEPSTTPEWAQQASRFPEHEQRSGPSKSGNTSSKKRTFVPRSSARSRSGPGAKASRPGSNTVGSA